MTKEKYNFEFLTDYSIEKIVDYGNTELTLELEKVWQLKRIADSLKMKEDDFLEGYFGRKE